MGAVPGEVHSRFKTVRGNGVEPKIGGKGVEPDRVLSDDEIKALANQIHVDLLISTLTSSGRPHKVCPARKILDACAVRASKRS